MSIIQLYMYVARIYCHYFDFHYFVKYEKNIWLRIVYYCHLFNLPLLITSFRARFGSSTTLIGRYHPFLGTVTLPSSIFPFLAVNTRSLSLKRMAQVQVFKRFEYRSDGRPYKHFDIVADYTMVASRETKVTEALVLRFVDLPPVRHRCLRISNTYIERLHFK